MIYAFTEAIRATIEGLDWIDNYGGLCYPIERRREDGQVERFPVSCGATDDDCKNISTYYRFTPDDRKMSVSWWEQQSEVTENRDIIPGSTQYSFRVRFICWLNLDRMGLTGCGYDEIAALQFKGALGRSASAASGILQNANIYIDFNRMVQKSPDIFSRYTFNHLDIPYLFKPYDYFAIDYDIKIDLMDGCLPEITLGTPINC